MSSDDNRVDQAVQPTAHDDPKYRDFFNTGAAKRKSKVRKKGASVAVKEGPTKTATGLTVSDIKEVVDEVTGKKVFVYQLKRKNGELYKEGKWFSQDDLLDD